MSQVVQHFVQLLAEVAPWFLGGTILGAAMQAYLKPAWVLRWMGSQSASVFHAAVAGAVLPGCSLTTVPLAASLQKQGARLGTLTAFIMISPILSPETIALTGALLGHEMTVARIALPLAATLLLGLALNSLEARQIRGFHLPALAAAPAASCGGSSTSCDERPGFWKLFRDLLNPLWIYFVAGLLAVAVLQTFVPSGNVDQFMRGGLAAYLVAAAAGIPLYVCEGAEVPLTLSLLKMGVGAGPAFPFMLGAVGTCLPTIVMAPRIIGAAATYVYVGAWLVLAVGAGMFLSLAM